MSLNLLYRRSFLPLKHSALTQEAEAEIFNSYGQAVLSATLAFVSTNPQYVPFINEDPHIVCSLLNTGYTRWLVGDGTAYLDSLWQPRQNNFEIQTRYIYTQTQQTNAVLYGSVWGDSVNGMVFMQGNASYVQTGNVVKRGQSIGVSANADVVMSHNSTEIKTIISGTMRTAAIGATSISNTDSMWIFKKQNGADLVFSGKMAYLYILFGSSYHKRFVPFISQERDATKVSTGTNVSANTKGLIDLENDIFYPNIGGGSLNISETVN